MKTCTHCQTTNADASNFCKQCGKPLTTPPPGDKTVFWHGQRVGSTPAPYRDTDVATLFGAKDRLVVGRAPDCDVCLPHPMVSRYHALLERRADGLRLRDLASVNGVWVGGRRITEPVFLREGQHVGVGPFLFSLRQGVIRSVDSSRSLRLEARGLEKVIALGGGKTRKLLDDINLVVQPGEFVSLLGPSGSGKSTLMDCLNGRRRATGGEVLANGEDFYRHFDNFRQSLGYVPQKDIVHTGLTVYRALYYTARLRLPTDTDPAELRARIDEVLRQMELVPHRDTLVANLSGGQIKRVSLGAELLAQPSLLYIDEATSGLDAGTETRMMHLFRRLADEGRTIVCITHNLENVDRCHLILVLARGKLMFYGPPGEAPPYFKVGRISEIYDRLGEKEPELWEKEFRACSLHEEFVAGRLAASPEPAEGAREPAAEGGRWSGLLAEGRKLVSRSEWPPLADAFRGLTARYLKVREWFSPVLDLVHQFRVLTARYVELVLNDRRSLRLLLLQAPIVAAFLLLGFVKKPFNETISPFDVFATKDGELTRDSANLLSKLRVSYELAGEPREMNGRELYDLYRQIKLQRPELLLDPETRDQLPVEVDFKGERLKLDHSDWQRLRDATERKSPRYTYMLLFMLVVVVTWFGCNNAAKEIVKEEAVYSRERAVNLGIVPYLASKFLVLSVITIVHSLLLMVVIFGALALLKEVWPGCTVPPPEHRLGYPVMFGVLALLSMTGVALGLLLSACVTSPDRANALLPYVLIPQLILGGGFLKVTSGPLFYLAAILSPVYWAYRAVHLGANQLAESFPGHVDYEDRLTLPCVMLVAQTLLLLLATAWFLRRKEA